MVDTIANYHSNDLSFDNSLNYHEPQTSNIMNNKSIQENMTSNPIDKLPPFSPNQCSSLKYMHLELLASSNSKSKISDVDEGDMSKASKASTKQASQVGTALDGDSVIIAHEKETPPPSPTSSLISQEDSSISIIPDTEGIVIGLNKICLQKPLKSRIPTNKSMKERPKPCRHDKSNRGRSTSPLSMKNLENYLFNEFDTNNIKKNDINKLNNRKCTPPPTTKPIRFLNRQVRSSSDTIYPSSSLIMNQRRMGTPVVIQRRCNSTSSDNVSLNSASFASTPTRTSISATRTPTPFKPSNRKDFMNKTLGRSITRKHALSIPTYQEVSESSSTTSTPSSNLDETNKVKRMPISRQSSTSTTVDLAIPRKKGPVRRIGKGNVLNRRIKTL